MNIWIRLMLWASIVGLHFAVLWADPVDGCRVGLVDPGGPIFFIYVNERDIWLHALLMLSVLVLMPIGLRIGGKSGDAKVQWIEGMAGYLLGLSLLFGPVDPRVLMSSHPVDERVVPLGFLGSLPWLLVRGRAAAAVLVGWIRVGVPRPASLCMESARIFPAIGAAWLVAHRANWTPFGFDPLIVLLTAAHFHHAGFTLPWMAGLNAKAKPGCWTWFSCVSILAGVPLVAAGITCTHFGVLPFVEPFGVTILVLGALGVAVSQLLRGIEFRSGLSIWTRTGFVISGASLLVAMLLAMSFGLRYVFPRFALTMPQMWMIHGTLNAFGFGLCGILAWRGAEVRRTCVENG